MNKLYFTIGLPRSGKSTLCKKWQQNKLFIENHTFLESMNKLDEPEYPRVVVTPDYWRLALGHRYNWHTEPVVFSHVQIAVRAMLKAGYDVLVDDTHTTENSIIRLFEENIEAQYIYVNQLLGVCMDRATKTNQSDLIPVIRKLDTNLSTLTARYGSIENACNYLSNRAKHNKSIGVITHE